MILRNFPSDKIKLSLDRTNWEFGSKKINYLCLAAQCRGASIPIMTWELDRDGNSSSTERVEVISELLKLIPVERIADFTSDREFVGDDWLDFLIDNKINFTIRMRGNIPFGRKRCDSFSEGIHSRTDCEGNQTYLAVHKDWLLLTNHSPAEANKRYKQRWKIEEMFQFLKKRGFNLEDTHLRSPKKLVTLINLLSLT